MNDTFSVFLRNLLSDDDLLKKFLADPVKTGAESGISKAHWSVVRRVLVGASTASTNGYSIVRPLSGYRQAVKMLYNVMRQQSLTALTSASDCSGGAVAIAVSWGPDVTNPGFHPFLNVAVWILQPVPTPISIATAMDEIKKSGEPSKLCTYGPNFQLDFEDEPSFNPKRIIQSFEIQNNRYYAPPGNHAYPFWFWSINGYPNPHDSGTFGESYADAVLYPGDIAYWDCIVPDSKYGFPACPLTNGTHTQNLM